jgi:predicted TIM-barrel fold metal-dependent hydrolase
LTAGGPSLTLGGVIIDVHTHIFPPEVSERRAEYVKRDATFAEMYANPRADIATVDDLLASMDEAAVNTSVALGFAWGDAETVSAHNDYLLEAAAHSGGRIVPFCNVNMADPGAAEEVGRCAARHARGLGELRPDSQGWDLNGAAGDQLAEMARRLNLVLLFHVTEPGFRSYPGRAGCKLESFQAFANKHPDLWIIGAHFGGGFYTGDPGSPASPFVDTAAQPFLHPGEHARRELACVPLDRILFGSDFPLISQARQIAELRTAIAEEGHLSAALGRNAEALLHAAKIRP